MHRSCLAISLWTLAVLPSVSAPAAPSPSPSHGVLTPAEDLVVAFGEGDARAFFHVDLGDFDFAMVAADQLGVDVEMVDPGGPPGPCGSQPWSVDLRRRLDGTEYLPLARRPDRAAARVSLRRRSGGADAARSGGRVVLRVEEAVRSAHGVDLCRGWRAFLDARVAALDRSAEGQESALAPYRRSVEFFRRAGDDRALGQALLNQAIVLRRLGRLTDAVDLLAESRRRLSRHESAKDDLADACSEAGMVFERLGHFDVAAALFEDALALARDLDDRSRMSRALNGLGLVHKRLDRWFEALDLYRRALELGPGDPCTQSAAHVNLAQIQTRLGDFHGALDHAVQAAQLARGPEDVAERSAPCRNLGAALNALGLIYGTLGRWRVAASTYREALPLVDRASRPALLINLGRALQELGDVEDARQAYLDAAARAEELGDRRMLFSVRSNLGHLALHDLGDPDRARRHLAEAATLVRDTGGLLPALLQIQQSELALALGEHDAAADLAQAALSSATGLGSPPLEASALRLLAETRLRQGDSFAALEFSERAVSRLEALRRGAQDPDLRASFLSRRVRFYEVWIEALLACHRRQPEADWLARSVEVAERARARTLLDMLDSAAVERSQDVDPYLAELERQMAALDIRRDRMLETGNDGEAKRLASDLAGLQAQILERRARLRISRPRWSDLRSGETLDAQGMRRQVVDEETVLLHSFVGETRGWLWLMSESDLRVVEISELETLSPQVRHLLDSLTAPGRVVDGEDLRARRHRVRAALEAQEELRRSLSRRLLGELLPTLDPKVRRMVVVADGPLALLPWSALLRPDRDPARPLVLDYEWVQLPSVSVLASLRRLAGTAPPARGDATAADDARPLLAVLADPVFSLSDPRLSGRGEIATARQSLGQRTFRRLPETAEEARVLASLAPGRSLVATGFDATAEMARSGALAPYRIVHFATHGVIETEFPELSALVLTQVDADGRPVDGFLRLPDIYRLRLSADAVVLSACETALGQQLRGEGLIGLVRGFLYAGASRVVASLWSVDDRATRELMEQVYRHVLEDGRSFAASLHAVQREMAQRGESPRAWSAFVLQGDWRAPNDRAGDG